jgi:hypothetical protein
MPVIILVPGSHERLTLRKHVMCSRNMGAHVQCGIWSTKGRKRDEKSVSRTTKKGAKKLVSSNVAKILEKKKVAIKIRETCEKTLFTPSNPNKATNPIATA